MRLQKKSLSKVFLTDLLRRKKITLEKYLKETGIVTYELLVSRCESSGLVPPSHDEFISSRGENSVTPSVSSPTEGVVVLEPPPVLKIVTESDGSVLELKVEDLNESDNNDKATITDPVDTFQALSKREKKKR